MSFGFGIGFGLGLTRGIGVSIPLTISGLTGSDARIGTTVTALEGGAAPSGSVQWQADGVDIPGATSATYVVSATYDAQLLTWTDGTLTAAAAQIRHAPGSVTESTLAAWTIDDDTLNISFASDFSTPNLTGSYVITGLPTGAVDDGDGTISGTPTGQPGTASIQVTFTDQYGRKIVGTYPVPIAYRPQAVAAGGLGPFSFTEGSAITAVDLAADFTANGNTLTFAIAGAALPSALSVSSAGLMTGTPAGVTSATSYTVRATDEYGNQTDSTFSLEVTTAPVGDTTAPSAASVVAALVGGDVQVTITDLNEDIDTGTIYVTDSDVALAAVAGAAIASQTFSITAAPATQTVTIADNLIGVGTKYVYVEFRDTAGNTRMNAAGSVVIAAGAWDGPTINSTSDGVVNLSAGANAPATPAAPTIVSTGSGRVTLDAA